LSIAAHELPRNSVNAKQIALISSAAIVIGVLLSGFVIREPAPYEIYMAGLIAVWAMFGLRISRAIMPLVTLLLLFNIGGMIAMTQM
jgi:xanthosine utilization system XapX-like protein